MANLYQVLNVATTDPHNVIKKAFQRIALTHHPDKTRNLPARERNAKEEKFKAANNAWETLSDATKRSAYDQSLLRKGQLTANPSDAPTSTFASANANRSTRSKPPNPKPFSSTSSTWQHHGFDPRPHSGGYNPNTHPLGTPEFPFRKVPSTTRNVDVESPSYHPTPGVFGSSSSPKWKADTVFGDLSNPRPAFDPRFASSMSGPDSKPTYSSGPGIRSGSFGLSPGLFDAPPRTLYVHRTPQRTSISYKNIKNWDFSIGISGKFSLEVDPLFTSTETSSTSMEVDMRLRRTLQAASFGEDEVFVNLRSCPRSQNITLASLFEEDPSGIRLRLTFTTKAPSKPPWSFGFRADWNEKAPASSTFRVTDIIFNDVTNPQDLLLEIPIRALKQDYPDMEFHHEHWPRDGVCPYLTSHGKTFQMAIAVGWLHDPDTAMSM